MAARRGRTSLQLWRNMALGQPMKKLDNLRNIRFAPLLLPPPQHHDLNRTCREAVLNDGLSYVVFVLGGLRQYHLTHARCVWRHERMAVSLCCGSSRSSHCSDPMRAQMPIPRACCPRPPSHSSALVALGCLQSVPKRPRRS